MASLLSPVKMSPPAGGFHVNFMGRKPGFPYIMSPNATLDMDVNVSNLGSDAGLLVREFSKKVDAVEISLAD